jgi:hypothetical protein
MRRLHIGPEQRRRDKLTASYHRLKNAVPSQGLCRVSRPRPSKMALLECATDRINSLEKSRQQLIAKILKVEEEAARLRQCVHSELLMCGFDDPTIKGRQRGVGAERRWSKSNRCAYLTVTTTSQQLRAVWKPF